MFAAGLRHRKGHCARLAAPSGWCDVRFAVRVRVVPKAPLWR